MKALRQTSLRARVARGLIVLGIFLLVTQGLAVIVISEYQEEAFIDHILLDEADRLVKQQPGDALGGLVRYVVRNPEDKAKLPEKLRRFGPGLHDIHINGREFHVAVQPAQGVTYYLLYDASPHEHRVKEFRHRLLIGIVVSILLLVWAGIWLSGRLVAQVGDLAQKVQRAQPGSPLDMQSYRDAEVQTLANAFEAYSGRVVELLEREKEFTANASHELRTPLTTIKTSCELLGEEALSAKAQARLQQIAQGAERMTEVVSALLLLAREAPMEPDAIFLRALVEESLDPLRPALLEKNIALEVDIDPAATVQANRAALILLLNNLLKNALRYTGQGRITVAYDEGVLSVADTGSGIAPEDMPHIFDRGFRGGNAQEQGSGLGLAIVQRVADRFGWKMAVHSRFGEGSNFSVDLRPGMN